MSINPFVVLIAIVILGVAALGGVYFLTASRITVVIDGTPIETRSHQKDVLGLLTELQLDDNTSTVLPAPETELRSGMTVTVERQRFVIIDANDHRYAVSTRSVDPMEILAQAGLSLGEKDVLNVDGADFEPGAYTKPPQHLVILRARTIKLDDNGTMKSITSVHTTVGEVLHDAQITLYAADDIDPSLTDALPENGTVTLRRSLPIAVQADGHSLRTRTHAKTVGAALADIGIVPIGLDYVIPDLPNAITANMAIRIVRVTEEDISEQTLLDFKRVTQSDPTLPIDTYQIIQQGMKGIQEQRIRVRREDGIEVSRSAPQVVIVQPPRDEITAIGTLPTLKTLSTPNGQIDYWRVLKMRAASYKPSSTGKTSDDPTYGITATGEKLRKGIVAVDPKVIPLGTSLYVPGYGTAIAADTGGAVTGLVIDLGYNDDDYQEWSGEVEVYLMPAAADVPLLPKIPEETK